MSKRPLTNKQIEALPRKKGERYDVPDPGARRLWLRVGSRGIKFQLIVRLPGADNTTRLTIGAYPSTTLEQARDEANRINAMIDRGLDPREEDARIAVEHAQRLRATFRSALEDYLADIPSRINNRSAAAEAKNMRRELLDPARNPWLDKPLAAVEDCDVTTLIAAIRDRGNRTTAYNLFRNVKTFFNWAAAAGRRRNYYLETTPIATTMAATLELSRAHRDRCLDASEIAAYWVAAAATPYPYGPFFRSMLLTGQRENEVAGMRWSELDLKRRLWTIPARRYKGKRHHTVPLSDEMMELIETVRYGLPSGHGDLRRDNQDENARQSR